MGLAYVKISGGEPLLRASTVAEVLEHTAARGLATRLETDGTVIDDAMGRHPSTHEGIGLGQRRWRERFRSLGDCRVADAATCARCRFNKVCSGGCRAEAYRAFGILDAPDPACAILPDSAIHSLPQAADLCGRGRRIELIPIARPAAHV